MGLDVDVYKVEKKNITETTDLYWDVIEKNKFVEQIYMRKPYMIWVDVLEIIQYKNDHILSKKEKEEIRQILKKTIKNFTKKYMKEFNLKSKKEIDFDSFIYHLKKYVDFYYILEEPEFNTDDYQIIISWCQ